MTGGSIRLRLLVAAAISVGAALLVAGFGLVYLFERHVERRIAVELSADVDRLVAGIAETTEGDLVVAEPPPDPRFGIPLSGLYWQVEDPASGALLRSRSLWDVRLTPPLPWTETSLRLVEMGGPGGTLLVGVQRTAFGIPGAPSRRLQMVVAQDHHEVTVAAHEFGLNLIPSLALLATALIVAAAVQVAIGLAPLERLRNAVAEVVAGRSARLQARVPSEVRPLAEEINHLLDAQEKALARARSRAADLAHGLRTPLQVLAADVRRLRERGAADIAADIDEVAATLLRHVDRELARARMASPGESRQPAPVAGIVDKVVSVVQRTPQGGALEFDNAVPPGLMVAIDPDDLTEMLGNLIENATRYGRSIVRITADYRGDAVRLMVTDDGPGIPDPEQRAAALGRGTRLDSTGGAGLGLAIASDVAVAHGGSLTLEDAGPGLRAILTFPAARSGGG